MYVCIHVYVWFSNAALLVYIYFFSVWQITIRVFDSVFGKNFSCCNKFVAFSSEKPSKLVHCIRHIKITWNDARGTTTHCLMFCTLSLAHLHTCTCFCIYAPVRIHECIDGGFFSQSPVYTAKRYNFTYGWSFGQSLRLASIIVCTIIFCCKFLYITLSNWIILLVLLLFFCQLVFNSFCFFLIWFIYFELKFTFSFAQFFTPIFNSRLFCIAHTRTNMESGMLFASKN